MEGTTGIPAGGIFPHNLIGGVMRTFTENGWPYPEEICTFWNEAIVLAMQNAEDNSLSGYIQYDAEAELLGALGLFKSMYIPHIWHEELQGREDSAKEEELRQEMARLKLQQEARDILGLKQPDPPQTASIKVTHIDWEGRSTKFPLSYGPVLLKEDGDWKYHNTISIPSTHLNEIIRELDSIRERIYLNERMAVQTLGTLPCGTPMMAGQSSHSTA